MHWRFLVANSVCKVHDLQINQYNRIVKLTLADSNKLYRQVSTPHNGGKKGIDQQNYNRKLISRKSMHPQSLFK